MKITITGGSGFLGSHVADVLSRKGHKVKIFDKKKSKWLRRDQKILLGDIIEYNKLERAIKGTDVVYHFAALSNINEALKKPVQSVYSNILGTVKALELSRKHNVKRFILASTIYVNSVEGGFYRSSKKAAEEYVEEFHKIFGLNYTILRFGSLYGERSDITNGITNIIHNALLKGEISYEGSKHFVREYIHVQDAAKACTTILKDKYKNKYIILAGSKKIKVYYFLKKLAKILKISKKIKFYNKKYIGHYTVTPFTYKPRSGEKFELNSEINFDKGLSQLIKKIKNSKKYIKR